MANVQLAKNLKNTSQKIQLYPARRKYFFEYYQTGILSLRAGTSGAGSEYTGSSLPILSGHFGRTYCRQHSCRPDPGIYAHL